MTKEIKRAVVLVSGGLDSATVLAIAQSKGFQCYALSMDYGQRHRIELERAETVAQAGGAIEHRIVKIDIGGFGGSALTDNDIAVPSHEQESEEIPVTYVPARNTVFLSVALSWAEVLGANTIFIGANAVDYSGYPDCRQEYLDSFQAMANLATKVGVEADEDQIRIEAPLIDLTKAKIIRKGTELGVDYGLTVSCYNPGPNGEQCGKCDSCRIRAQGFADAELVDPAA